MFKDKNIPNNYLVCNFITDEEGNICGFIADSERLFDSEYEALHYFQKMVRVAPNGMKWEVRKTLPMAGTLRSY